MSSSLLSKMALLSLSAAVAHSATDALSGLDLTTAKAVPTTCSAQDLTATYTQCLEACMHPAVLECSDMQSRFQIVKCGAEADKCGGAQSSVIRQAQTDRLAQVCQSGETFTLEEVTLAFATEDQIKRSPEMIRQVQNGGPMSYQPTRTTSHENLPTRTTSHENLDATPTTSHQNMNMYGGMGKQIPSRRITTDGDDDSQVPVWEQKHDHDHDDEMEQGRRGRRSSLMGQNMRNATRSKNGDDSDDMSSSSNGKPTTIGILDGEDNTSTKNGKSPVKKYKSIDGKGPVDENDDDEHDDDEHNADDHEHNDDGTDVVKHGSENAVEEYTWGKPSGSSGEADKSGDNNDDGVNGNGDKDYTGIDGVSGNGDGNADDSANADAAGTNGTGAGAVGMAGDKYKPVTSVPFKTTTKPNSASQIFPVLSAAMAFAAAYMMSA